ncbi:hypothetical protein BH23BAC1_BH23BAC1_10470 [soil metagenome]
MGFFHVDKIYERIYSYIKIKKKLNIMASINIQKPKSVVVIFLNIFLRN